VTEAGHFVMVSTIVDSEVEVVSEATALLPLIGDIVMEVGTRLKDAAVLSNVLLGTLVSIDDGT
jgi:hypothetical protein